MQWSRSSSGLYAEMRLDEMRALESLLLDTRGRVVNIHGAPGSGKTSLALDFSRRHVEAFPGGTTVIACGDVTNSADALLGLSAIEDERALFILDDIDKMPLDVLSETFGRIRRLRPEPGVITTSGIPVIATADTYPVGMPPLQASQIVKLLGEQSGIPAQRLESLALLLEGNLTAAEEASHRLASGMPADRIVEWFESGRLASAWDPSGRALPSESPARTRLDVAVTEVSETLIAELAERPEMLYELDPRKFEELVAELYRRQGFETTLTPASGDEGVDIYVVSRNDLGRALWVVQAKRYAAENRIGAGVVRELYGTVAAKDASAGILVTTSFFQPGATKLEREFEYRLSLKNYLDLQELLRKPKSPSAS